jgi:hypothetical protein
LFRNVQLRNSLPSDFESRLDDFISREISDPKFLLLKVKTEDLNNLLLVISSFIDTQKYKFIKTSACLYDRVSLKESYENSKIIINWIGSNNIKTDTSNILTRYILELISNPTFLIVNVENMPILKDYFNFINLIAAESLTPNLDVLANKPVDGTHTVALLNKYPAEFISLFFDFLKKLQLQLRIQLPFAEAIYYYVLSNYKLIPKDTLTTTLSNMIYLFNYVKQNLVSDSKEINSLIAIYKDTSLEDQLRFGAFKLKSVLTSSWWAEDEIRYIKRFKSFLSLVEEPIESKFFSQLEYRLLYIINPSEWHSERNYHSIFIDACKLVPEVKKVYNIDDNLIINKIQKAISYYKSTKSYVFEIKAIYEILLSDLVRSALPKKGKFASDLRFMMKKYSTLRKSVGQSLNKKFELNIASIHFKTGK